MISAPSILGIDGEVTGTALALEGAGVAGVVVVGDLPGGVPGGDRRRDSVAAGLGALPSDASHVLIHDAARPLATVELVCRVRDRLGVGDVDGVVPGLAVRDTLKRPNWTKVDLIKVFEDMRVAAFGRSHSNMKALTWP